MSRVLNLIRAARSLTNTFAHIQAITVFSPVKFPTEISSTRSISNRLFQHILISGENKKLMTRSSLKSFDIAKRTESTQINNSKINNTIDHWRRYNRMYHASSVFPEIPDCGIEELFNIFRQAIINEDKQLLALAESVLYLPYHLLTQQAFKIVRTQKLNFTELYPKYRSLKNDNASIPKTFGLLALTQAGSKLDMEFIKRYGSDCNLIGDRAIANQIFRAIYLTEEKLVFDIVNAIFTLRTISQNSFSYAYHSPQDQGNYLYHLFLKDKEPWYMTEFIDKLVPVNDGHSGYSPGGVFFKSCQEKQSPYTMLVKSGNPHWKKIAEKINLKNNFFHYRNESARYEALDNTLKMYEQSNTLLCSL